MLIEYLPILLLIIAALLFAGGSVLLSALVGPKRPLPAKLAPYECGIAPVGLARERFSIKFYLVAMLFIIFDIEIIFLYPWAVIYRELGWFGPKNVCFADDFGEGRKIFFARFGVKNVDAASKIASES